MGRSGRGLTQKADAVRAAHPLGVSFGHANHNMRKERLNVDMKTKLKKKRLYCQRFSTQHCEAARYCRAVCAALSLAYAPDVASPSLAEYTQANASSLTRGDPFMGRARYIRQRILRALRPSFGVSQRKKVGRSFVFE